MEDIKEKPKGLGNKVICLCSLAASTQASSLHGVNSTAQELIGIFLPAVLKILSYA